MELSVDQKILINDIKKLESNFSRTAWDVGKKLIDLKTLCEHGEFEKVVSDNFEFGMRHAQRFMRINRTFKSDQMVAFGYTKLMSLLRIADDEERSKFVDMIPEEKVPPLKQLDQQIDIFKETKKIESGPDKQCLDLDFKVKKLLQDMKNLNDNIHTTNMLISGILSSKKDKLSTYVNIANLKINITELNKIEKENLEDLE